MVGFNSVGLSRALSQLNKVSKQYDAQVDVIASGKKKLSGADFSKASRYEAQMRGASSVKENLLDVVDMMDTADAGLDTVSSSLIKIRGYYQDGVDVAATSDDIDTAQSAINAEIGAIDKISTDTEYNGRTILYDASDFYVQSGTNQNNGYTVGIAAKGSYDQKGIQIRVDESTGGNDSGTLVEDVSAADFALDEISVGSLNVKSYDNRFYSTTTDGLDHIDQMSSNVSRMRAQVLGEKAKVEAHYSHMSNYEDTMSDALERIQGIDFATEISRLNDMQVQKQSISSLIATANASNATILSLLP